MPTTTSSAGAERQTVVELTNTAIVLTPPGAAAIAVMRLSGPHVVQFLRAHFSRPAAHGRCVHGELTDDGRVIDDAVVILVDPQTADINLHGGTWVVRAATELVRRKGFELLDTRSGALPEQAVDYDSELEREVLTHLPLARTELGVRTLLAQPGAWARLTVAPPAVQRAELERLALDPTLRYLLWPPSVAIIGAANVGKSTLANQLFAQERSITADMPGTTRDWVGEIANLDGLPVMLLDTPGLRQTDDLIERTAVERSRVQIERADLLVLLLDASRPLEGEQLSLVEEFPAALKVVNKYDCPSKWDAGTVDAVCRTIATRGEGVGRLRREIIRRLCGSERIAPERPYVWTTRQRAIVQRAMDDPAALVFV